MEEDRDVQEIESLARGYRRPNGSAVPPQFFGPVDEGGVIAAESDLMLSFPRSYRNFLRELGAANMFGWDFPGLPSTRDDDCETPAFLNVVDQTRAFWRDWAPLSRQLIYISCNGGDAYFFLDTSVDVPGGEAPVVVYAHDVEKCVVAPSFLEFIRKRSKGAPLW